MKQNWKTVGQVIARASVIISFLIISGVLLASANGYLFDQSKFRFEETSLISLSVEPTPVVVSVNGKKRSFSKEDINLSYLLPGHYTVEIRKEKYHPWSKTFAINAGEAVINPWVTLFLEDGNIQPATTEQSAILDAVEEPQTLAPDLDVRGSELWVKPVSRTYPFTITSSTYDLIGRYSGPIQRAIWYQGRNRLRTHIIFQVDREIRIIDRDGTNDVVLATLSSSSPSLFAVSNDGNILVYRDGDTVFQRHLQ